MAQDKIFINDLLVRGILGLNDWERVKKQDILINLELTFDTRRAGRDDDVAHTLNYRTLAKAVIAYVEDSSHLLVETLVAEVARICVVDHGAEAARVRIEKPGALRFARSVGVEIERHREDFGS
ncbi:MAG: dihydroneopterin aldolase [Acidobacteriota bacterium]